MAVQQSHPVLFPVQFFFFNAGVDGVQLKEAIETSKHNTEDNVFEHNFYAEYTFPTKKD